MHIRLSPTLRIHDDGLQWQLQRLYGKTWTPIAYVGSRCPTIVLREIAERPVRTGKDLDPTGEAADKLREMGAREPLIIRAGFRLPKKPHRKAA